MPQLSNQTLQVVATIVIALSAIAVIFVRLQAAKRPTSVKKIIIPPLGMSTGFLMFLSPVMQIPWLYALIALFVGFLFSIPLIATSHMQEIDEEIYLKRSPAFIIVLLSLLVIRLSLHTYIEKYITLPQTGGAFFILAFGMLLPWRLVMYFRFKKYDANRIKQPSLSHYNTK